MALCESAVDELLVALFLVWERSLDQEVGPVTPHRLGVSQEPGRHLVNCHAPEWAVPTRRTSRKVERPGKRLTRPPSVVGRLLFRLPPPHRFLHRFLL